MKGQLVQIAVEQADREVGDRDRCRECKGEASMMRVLAVRVSAHRVKKLKLG